MMDFSKAYNRADFVNYLRRDFLPDDFEQEEKNVPFWTQMNYASVATCLGKSKTLDLVVYEIKHRSLHDARVGLSKDAFRMLAGEKQNRALVIFVPENNSNNYRFSLIEIKLSIGENDSNVTRTYSNPRRYSYYLGKGIACYTPNKYLNELGRVKDVKDLFERFSVEVLTKAFYQELSDWYAWAIKVISFPNDISTHVDDKRHNHEGVIRLITRLIFVWFLKERKLIPWQFFDQEYIANHLIKGFNPHKIDNLFGKSEASVYYRAILQNLFFAMLNCPITKEGSAEFTERRFKDNRSQFDDNKLMRYRDEFNNPDEFLRLANETVPFLNGGLFDCLDEKRSGMYYDGFSERKESMAQLIVPDYLFFGEEAGKNIDLSEFYGDANKKKVSARGIIDILKRYNFTVEENMPFDKDVSLDPELLGKVFENLLASYNPETQQTARKQTGSFYTPREIVQYMVDESLVAHLKRTVGNELESEYRKLLDYADNEILLTEQQKLAIMQSLYNCKILDPACGSGAFPVGVLQQMVHILTKIDPDNSRWQKMLFDITLDENSSAYQSLTKEEQAELKDDLYRSFNENFNRPDYSRKLYLIENCIYGVDIQSIAIQISKLRFFISLIIDQKINNNPADNFGIRPLPNLEAKFVAANSLISLNRKESTLFDSDKIKDKEAKLKIAKHKIFSAKTSKTKEKYREQVRALRKEIADLLIEQHMVGNEQAQQLDQWDIFDQNASSPFFDPEWMFGVKGGFDIVIANPPFIDSENMVNQGMEQLRAFLVKTYKRLSGNWDMYMAFLERSLNLSPIVCYITPDKWLSRPFGEKMREHEMRSRLYSIAHAGAKVFESATVDAIITLFVDNSKHLSTYVFKSNSEICHINTEDISNLPKPYLIDYLFSSNAAIVSKIDSLTKKIHNLGVECEGACATSDAYKLVPLIKSLKKPNKNYYKLINTGTLIKFGNLWGCKPISYLGIKDEYPVVLKQEFENTFGKTYIQRARRKKLVMKGLNLLDVCLDDKAEFIPGKTMLVICSEDIALLKVLLVILNSKLIFWYLRIKYSSSSYCGGLTFTKDMINFIPIPELSSKAYDSLIKLATEAVSSDVFPLDKMNVFVYHLYNLTYDEILIVDRDSQITREEYDNFKL